MIKICNICGGDVSLLTSEQLYGERYKELNKFHYSCNDCGVTVGCHNNTKKPLGTLADKKTKTARRKCHELLDPLWKIEKDGDYKNGSRGKKRLELYKLISEHLQIPIEETHFGMFNIEQCREAYLFILKYKAKLGLK